MDLSGTMQGAGGVGGLLAVKSGNAIHYPTFDGNGNVSEYLAADGAVAAHFEYDPFGNTVVNTDTTNQFAYRFSTKPQDSTTGLCYYGYRWMDSLTGRWPSRDPIEEKGGVNLYGFVGNDGLSNYDIQGLFGRSAADINSSARLAAAGFDWDGKTRITPPISGKEANAIEAQGFRGHAEFYNFFVVNKDGDFDYRYEDDNYPAGYVDPKTGIHTYLPWHFQDLKKSLDQAEKEAAVNCDIIEFQRRMHRAQDYFTHFSKGYRNGHQTNFIIRKPWSGKYTFGKWAKPGWYDKLVLSPDYDNEAWDKADAMVYDALKNIWLKHCCVKKSGGIIGLFSKKSWAIRKTVKCCEPDPEPVHPKTYKP